MSRAPCTISTGDRHWSIHPAAELDRVTVATEHWLACCVLHGSRVIAPTSAVRAALRRRPGASKGLGESVGGGVRAGGAGGRWG